jgi:hypothetical protein
VTNDGEHAHLKDAPLPFLSKTIIIIRRIRERERRRERR